MSKSWLTFFSKQIILLIFAFLIATTAPDVRISRVEPDLCENKMEIRQERNLYNGNQLHRVRQATSYHSRTTSNWHVFRNHKSDLSFSDSFSFRKSPRKKKKTEEADSLHRNSTLSFSKSCQAAKENIDSGCGVLKMTSKDDCQDLIFDKENDDLVRQTSLTN